MDRSTIAVIVVVVIFIAVLYIVTFIKWLKKRRLNKEYETYKYKKLFNRNKTFETEEYNEEYNDNKLPTDYITKDELINIVQNEIHGQKDNKEHKKFHFTF